MVNNLIIRITEEIQMKILGMPGEEWAAAREDLEITALIQQAESFYP